MKIFPLFLPHLGCNYNCVYCDQKAITNVENPPVDLVLKDVKKFCDYNISDEKEIAFFGGTFTNVKDELQQKYLNTVNIYRGKFNGIRISTRPDSIDQEILDNCRTNNIRTIELGIQSFDDDVLKATKRGYTSQQAIDSCLLIKKYGFLLGIQLMPGLPGFNGKSLERSIQETIKLNPDFIRIYPTIVLKNTILEKWYRSGKYRPSSLAESIAIVTKMIGAFEKERLKIIKVGLHSDINRSSVIAGPYHQSFGELVRAEILKNEILKNFEKKTLEISPLDISLFKGFDSKMMKEIKTKTDTAQLGIRVNKAIEKGNYYFTNKKPEYIW
ncbi:MAG: radical SAM protein [Candidatus Cloacimonetes bacterium]|nr:radical SAM protein [Candidatus Cloacimonadota bacterium]